LSGGDSIWYVTGRIQAAAPDPTNPDILYTAGDNGGVWKTTNSIHSSPSWVPLTDDKESLWFAGGYHPLIVHPSNNDLILGVVSGAGAGILLSDDSGQTWQFLGNNTFEGAEIGSIQVHQTNTNIFYLSVGRAGLWAVPGVYESTDAGVTWNRLTGLLDGRVSDVIVAKFNSNVLYAAVAGNSGALTSNNGIYRSSNGGATWQQVNGLPSASTLSNGWVRLESGSTQGIIYVVALTVDVNNDLIVRRFKTTNDGTTWSELEESSQAYEKRSWHLLLGVDPVDDNHIFVNDLYTLYESDDGGSNWSRVDVIKPGGGQPSTDLGRDWVNISFDANGDAVVTADQGIYRYSKDKKWSSVIGDLQVNQFYTITPDLQSLNTLYAVGQDDYHALKFSGSDQWDFMVGSIGECGKVLVDPGNSDLLYAYNPLDIDNFVKRSNDAGNTWTTLQGSKQWRKKEDYDLAYLTQKSFVIDPSNPSRLLLGTITVHEITNASSNNPTWKQISGILSPSNNTIYQYITSLAVADSDGDTIYAATNDGHLWATFNNGAQWDNYDNGLFGIAYGPVIALSINPTKSMQGFAVTRGTGGRSVWMFQIMLIGTPSHFNKYPIWSNITGNLPNNLAVWSILVDWQAQTPFLYIGTDRGVYYSDDLGNNWKKFGRGLPNTAISDLSYFSSKNILVAGTFGRGAWKTKFPKIDFDLVFPEKWFPWMLWVPPPPPEWFLEWKSQLSRGLSVDNVRRIKEGVADANIHLGRKPGQPVSAPDEFQHMNRKKTESQNK
jgi:photosystem II stability/assembly factor-like uncharacterized protein